MILSSLIDLVVPRERVFSKGHGWVLVLEEERVGAMRVLRCGGLYGEVVWLTRPLSEERRSAA